MYYISFPKDGRVTKAVVYGIYVLELVQTLVLTDDAFARFVRGYGDLHALGTGHTDWLAIPIFTGISRPSHIYVPRRS